jgi:DNA processing protein
MSALSYSIRTLDKESFPAFLREIPQPPERLFLAGTLPDPAEYYYLSVVGSRKFTSYGRDSVERIIAGLAGFPVCIVSGLAIGIDSITHRAALDHKLPTLAIPGSGLDERVLYPRAHLALAREIIASGGGLLSEYDHDLRAAPWTFPQRNRLMAGISHGTLVIEAEEKSGTLITARLALDYNKNVYAVPGSIFTATSKGTNTLIRQGATPITNAENLLDELGFNAPTPGMLDLTLFSPEEQEILVLLEKPCTREDILATTTLSHAKALATLTILEIKGAIREHLGKIERV